MKSTEGRGYLIRALEERFLPMLVEQGFARYALSSKDRDSAEMRCAFPLGYWKRSKGQDLDLVEIQFDKSGAARFVINIGVVPPQGVSLPWGTFAQSEAVASSLTEAFRLYSASGWPKWFSLGWLARDANARANAAVNKLIALYPEIEAWFATRSEGRHLRRFGFPQARKHIPVE